MKAEDAIRAQNGTIQSRENEARCSNRTEMCHFWLKYGHNSYLLDKFMLIIFFAAQKFFF